MTAQTDSQQAADTDVRVEVTVEAPIERAFDVFTRRVDTWWPRMYHLGQAERVDLVIEPRAGGRWYERGADGKEAEWGKVLVWEPPHHLVLAWQISARYATEPDPERASRVDVQFAADSPARTTVTLVHSQLERHGEGWQSLREGVANEGGWPGILKAYTQLVNS
jgi:uncharacterized protein YndB with AHSA1/START domain